MRILLLSLVIFLLSGCASLFAPGEDTIVIKSNPVGADVWIDGTKMGKTPFEISLDRDTFAQHKVTLSKDGYKAQKFLIEKTLATAAIFNLTSVTSWATDAITGNMFKYSPNSYYSELEPYNSATFTPSKLAPFVILNKNAIMKELATGENEYIKIYASFKKVSPEKLRRQLVLHFPKLVEIEDAVDWFNAAESIIL